MNVENIEKTQEALLGLLFSTHYNMHHFIDTSSCGTPCGTTLCLAGIAATLYTEDPDLYPSPENLNRHIDFQLKAESVFDLPDSLGAKVYTTALKSFQITNRIAEKIFYLSCWPKGLQELYSLGRFDIDRSFLIPPLVSFIEGSLSKTSYYDHVVASLYTTRYRYLHDSFWKILAGYLALESFIKYGDSWVENTDHWSMGDFLRDNPDAVARFISAAKNQLTAN